MTLLSVSFRKTVDRAPAWRSGGHGFNFRFFFFFVPRSCLVEFTVHNLHVVNKKCLQLEFESLQTILMGFANKED